jgi:hypothetical protein
MNDVDAQPEDDDAADDADWEDAGAGIVNLVFAGTGVYVATAIVATISPDSFGGLITGVSLALFAVGVVAFLWSYFVAVGRSRYDLIGIGGLYFLADSAPRVVRIRLLGALGVEVVVALVTASIRLFTAVAFGVLVPIFGLGLAGLWGARYGKFPPRDS